MRFPHRTKGKGKGCGQTKGVGKGSHQQAPLHNAAGQSSSVAAPKQRVPLSPDQVVEAAPSRIDKLKQVLATLGEEDDMHLAVQEALSIAEYQAREQRGKKKHENLGPHPSRAPLFQVWPFFVTPLFEGPPHDNKNNEKNNKNLKL